MKRARLTCRSIRSAAARIQFLVEDCGVRLAVAQPDSVVAAHVARTVGTATDACLCDFAPPPIAKDARESLAYIIFTSGSTGTPKGVMITHAAAQNTIRDINQRFAVSEHDRVLALSSFAFDLSVYDLFGVLAAGGTVVLPTDAESRDPAAWGRLVRTEGITIWNSVPALMELLLSHLFASDQNLGSSLRLALLSGDWISVSLPGRMWSLSPKTEIISLGGATEASIWSIAYPIHEVDPAWTSIPYGKPLANQHFYVVNSAGAQVRNGRNRRALYRRRRRGARLSQPARTQCREVRSRCVERRAARHDVSHGRLWPQGSGRQHRISRADR